MSVCSKSKVIAKKIYDQLSGTYDENPKARLLKQQKSFEKNFVKIDFPRM